MIYTALTIGPIYKTLDNARHTRELWAASYTFSYLMKKIIEKLEEDKGVARKFYLPYATTEELKASSRFGEGVLPDRLIYGASGGDAETLKGVVDAVLNDFACSVAKEISKSWDDVLKFFKNYFRFYIIEKELPDGANPILKLSPLLNSIELQANYSVEQEKYLEEFFFKINSTFLVEDGYAGVKHVKYSTLIEISTKEFEECDKYKSLRDRRKGKKWAQLSDQQLTEEDTEEEKEDRDLIDELKIDPRYKYKFRAAHKYVAIV
ncbi:MAG: type III-B CRISPR-associated protein Cas10/Cmr2, partial [Bacteroidota bacterium]